MSLFKGVDWVVSKRSLKQETPSARSVLTGKHANLLSVVSEFIGHVTADGEVLTGLYGQFVCGLPVDIWCFILQDKQTFSVYGKVIFYICFIFNYKIKIIKSKSQQECLGRLMWSWFNYVGSLCLRRYLIHLTTRGREWSSAYLVSK